MHPRSNDHRSPGWEGAMDSSGSDAHPTGFPHLEKAAPGRVCALRETQKGCRAWTHLDMGSLLNADGPYSNFRRRSAPWAFPTCRSSQNYDAALKGYPSVARFQIRWSEHNCRWPLPKTEPYGKC